MFSTEIRTKLPFVSIVEYGSLEYVGIISNQDKNVTLMYVYTLIESSEKKQRLLELGRIWWDESNRFIPIDIFLKGEMSEFIKYSIAMNTKDVVLLDGPCINLENISPRRSKKKTIKL